MHTALAITISAHYVCMFGKKCEQADGIPSEFRKQSSAENDKKQERSFVRTPLSLACDCRVSKWSALQHLGKFALHLSHYCELRFARRIRTGMPTHEKPVLSTKSIRWKNLLKITIFSTSFTRFFFAKFNATETFWQKVFAKKPSVKTLVTLHCLNVKTVSIEDWMT